MAAGDPGTPKRNYSATAAATKLTVSIAAATQGDTGTITVNSVAGFPTSFPYSIIIDTDTSKEEVLTVTASNGSTTLTVIRGENNTQAYAHQAGVSVRHSVSAREFTELQTHIAARGYDADSSIMANVDSHVHGLASGDGSVVGTTKSQTLTNKTISGSANTVTNIGTASLVDGSITTAKIVDSNVTTGKIADSAITSAKIADGTIVTGDIADSAITSAKIADGTIVNADINSAAAIDKTKIFGTAITAADTGTVTSTMIADGTIVNGDINSSAQIAYSKLNLTNTIVNADINAAAAIAMSKLAVDPTSRANHTGTQTAATISDLDSVIKSYKVTDLTAPTTSVSVNSQKIINLATPTSDTDAATKAYADTKAASALIGAANGIAPLDSNSKIPLDHIPASAIAETFVVASQSAMLATAAGVGDIAVRTDLNKSFILQSTPATTLGNWIELLTPTDSVLSVDGRTGTVTLDDKYATVANAANKLPLAGGTMSGAINMGTYAITNVADPTNMQDVVTKNYLNNAVLAPSNLTGPITSIGAATQIASQTGTGTKFVMDTSPTLVTPVLGVATATSINGTAIPSNKTLVATDSTAYVVPSQTGNSGKYLTTNGTTSSWGTIDLSAYATVTSVTNLTSTVNDNQILALMGAY